MLIYTLVIVYLVCTYINTDKIYKYKRRNPHISNGIDSSIFFMLYPVYVEIIPTYKRQEQSQKRGKIMSKVEMTGSYQGKVSVPFIKVISVFLANLDREFSGYDILKNTGLQSGTVYPMLGRLLEDGWLESEWKDNPQIGKPKRLCYTLTKGGRREALKILSETISPNIEKCFDTPVAVT